MCGTPVWVLMTQTELDQASRFLRTATSQIDRQQRMPSFSTIVKTTGIVGAQRPEFLPDTHLYAVMFVYLDESGDTGFRFGQGSSTHFVIALVMIDDPIPIHEAIDQLRRELGLPKEKEFKFSQMRDHTKENFFRAVRPFPFQVRCLIVDKTRLTSPNLRDKMTFYNFLVKMVLQNDFGTIRNATLVIDESVQDKKKQAHFASYLRAQLNPVDQKQER